MPEVYFILVEPQVPENIGASARAIHTMGFQQLILVNTELHQRSEARWMAHGSQHILDNAMCFDHLHEALEMVDFSIATTAKHRSVRENYIDCSDLPGFITQKSTQINKYALVFGREDQGLSNEQISLCNICSSIPMAANYPSINLAQATMIYAYTLSNLSLHYLTDSSDQANPDPSFEVLLDKSKKSLEKIGFDNKSLIYQRILERLSFLTDQDINLLHSILNKLEER